MLERCLYTQHEINALQRQKRTLPALSDESVRATPHGQSRKEEWLELGVLVPALRSSRSISDIELANIEIGLDPKKWDAKLYTLAAGEPMPMRALDALAYSAALDASKNRFS